MPRMEETSFPVSRNGRGQFAKGWCGGSGRPKALDEERYARAFLRALPPARLERIIRMLAERAEAGNVAAAKVLLERVLPVARPADPEAEPPVYIVLTPEKEAEYEAKTRELLRTKYGHG